MIKHLKKKKRFLNRLHEIEDRGSQVSEQVVQELQDLIKKQQDQIKTLTSSASSSSSNSELRDALNQLKSALSESTTDAINTQRLLDEQLVRLGNSLENAESKAAETAVETSKVIARLQSELGTLDHFFFFSDISCHITHIKRQISLSYTLSSRSRISKKETPKHVGKICKTFTTA